MYKLGLELAHGWLGEVGGYATLFNPTPEDYREATDLIFYVDAYPAGDHTLYTGHVEYLAYENGAPLLFYTGTYRNLEVQFWDDRYIW